MQGPPCFSGKQEILHVLLRLSEDLPLPHQGKTSPINEKVDRNKKQEKISGYQTYGNQISPKKKTFRRYVK